MNDDLLVSLRKYKVNANKNPLENFITESFAWMLVNNRDFSIFFLKHISSKINLKDEFLNHEWKTQVYFNGVYPDLVCFFENKAIVFEIKAYSGLHTNQLQNYRKYSEKKFEDYRLVLITANSSQHGQNPDLALRWEEVYEMILAYKEKFAENDYFILDSFLKLLDVEGLGPKAPISFESILYYYRSKNFEPQIKKLANIKIEKIRSVLENNDLQIEYQEKWGRVGVELFGDFWAPGVFVGFLLDGNDHLTIPILGDNSPDFSIIIDFNKELHTKYPDDELYKAFIVELQEKVNKIGNSWELYNHILDRNIDEHNYWHPIHIRKPVLELLRDTKTWDDQEKRVDDAIAEILPFIFKSENFRGMREKFLKPLTS